MKKLSKIATGVATTASLLYLFTAPAFALNLCPDLGNGVVVPGCSGANVTNVVTSVINILMFASFLIALVFLIIGGIRWILSGGDKEATAKAKGTVTSALVGLVIVLGAFVLINLVLTLITGGNLSNVSQITPKIQF